MRISVDTQAFDARERLEMWRRSLYDTFVGVDCRVEHEDGFRAVIDGFEDADHVISRMTSTGHVVQRSSTLIRRDGRETVFLVMVRRGNMAIFQDGREVVLRPGEMALDDSTRPFRSITGAGADVVRLSLPKASLADLVPGLDDLAAIRFTPTKALRRIVFGFLDALHPALADDRTIAHAGSLFAQARDLVAMTLLSQARSRLH